jgi:thioredoxin 1
MKKKYKGLFLFLFLLAALAVYTAWRSRAYHRSAESLADKSVIGQGKPVLMELGASWCPPCRLMMPVLKALSESHSRQFTVATVDVDEDAAAAGKYNVSAIPMLIFFDADGNELYRQTGYMSKEEILGKWEKLGLALNTTDPQEAEGMSAP